LINIIFESQKKFDDLKDITNLSYDFYIEINNKKICIEYDGKQHYNPVALFGGESVFIKQKKHDEMKTKYCVSNNMNLIRIKYNSKNKEEMLLEKIELIMNGDNIVDKNVYN